MAGSDGVLGARVGGTKQHGAGSGTTAHVFASTCGLEGALAGGEGRELWPTADRERAMEVLRWTNCKA